MNLILLSGGSGKRLWPLSDDIRSKQFLKLLIGPDGQLESMIQRVYRQVREIQCFDHIVVVTCAAQVEMIREQLGDDVEVVVEPQRRDTFPAIALAAAYLAQENGADATAVAMPVDVMAEHGYFEALGRIAKIAGEDETDLVLMGIRPRTPSGRFGYLIPGKDAKTVRRFCEKPTKDEAKRLIQEGALWNAGVFGFKLDYVLRWVRELAVPDTFETMLEGYKNLPKISFDYQVAEHTEKISYVLYDGEWKDLGVWDSILSGLEHDIGKAVRDAGSSGTRIINELEMPLMVLGIPNAAVVACPHGILVMDRSRCDELKEYVPLCEGGEQTN